MLSFFDLHFLSWGSDSKEIVLKQKVYVSFLGVTSSSSSSAFCFDQKCCPPFKFRKLMIVCCCSPGKCLHWEVHWYWLGVASPMANRQVVLGVSTCSPGTVWTLTLQAVVNAVAVGWVWIRQWCALLSYNHVYSLQPKIFSFVDLII